MRAIRHRSTQRFAGSSASPIKRAAGSGNFNQKAYPVNPIDYVRPFGIASVLRFVLTHPDMDHMDGIRDFFRAFAPVNFWDTQNTREIEFEDGSPYRAEDWEL